MKSIIIPIRGEKTPTNIKLIALHGFNVSSPSEISLLTALYELYSQNTFMLNEAVKQQIIAKTGGTSGTVKVNVSRLVKSGALVRHGMLIGLNTAFKDVKDIEQIILRAV